MVSMSLIPSGELKDLLLTGDAYAEIGINESNSLRGVESFFISFVFGRGSLVSMSLIPSGELKVFFGGQSGAQGILVSMSLIPSGELKV